MKSLTTLAALSAAFGGMSMPGEAVVIDRGYEPRERRSDFRMGRRFNYGFPVGRSASKSGRANGDNPAGTKLLKKASKGMLTKRKGW